MLKRGEHAARIPREAVAKLGDEHSVALVGLRLNEHREVEGIHQVEGGVVEAGGHGGLQSQV
ncbi:MAG: hypothetical protein QGH93_07410 [Gammaproteobacteria bacterium]|nr:hypothetical protein [Gammaproteobacteria bacterium]